MSDIKTSSAKIKTLAKIAGYVTTLLKFLPDEVVQQVVSFLLGLLPDEKLRKFVDRALDVVENAATKTENKIDDSIVLPICSKIRRVFNVPDGDD